MNRPYIFILFASLLFLIACHDENQQTDKQAEAVADQPTDLEVQNNNSGIPVVNRPAEVEVGTGIKPVQELGGAIQISWADLSQVSFSEKYFEEVGGNLLFPSFSDHIKSFRGKKVYISGYVIPIEPPSPDNPARYVLSANPFSSCFFCGNAGPESVMEIELKDKDQLFYTDDFYTFVGTFSLNDSDINKLNYIMQDAAVYKE